MKSLITVSIGVWNFHQYTVGQWVWENKGSGRKPVPCHSSSALGGQKWKECSMLSMLSAGSHGTSALRGGVGVWGQGEVLGNRFSVSGIPDMAAGYHKRAENKWQLCHSWSRGWGWGVGWFPCIRESLVQSVAGEQEGLPVWLLRGKPVP